LMLPKKISDLNPFTSIHVFVCFSSTFLCCPVFRCVVGFPSHGCPRPFLLVTCFLPTNVLSQGGSTMGRWALNKASLAGHGRGHRWGGGGGLRCSSWLWLCFPGVNMLRIDEQVQRPARWYQYPPLPKKLIVCLQSPGRTVHLDEIGIFRDEGISGPVLCTPRQRTGTRMNHVTVTSKPVSRREGPARQAGGPVGQNFFTASPLHQSIFHWCCPPRPHRFPPPIW